jgi:hypothetical protein
MGAAYPSFARLLAERRETKLPEPWCCYVSAARLAFAAEAMLEVLGA